MEKPVIELRSQYKALEDRHKELETQHELKSKMGDSLNEAETKIQTLESEIKEK